MSVDDLPEIPAFDPLVLDREQWQDDLKAFRMPSLAEYRDDGVYLLAKAVLDGFALIDKVIAERRDDDRPTLMARRTLTLYEALCTVTGADTPSHNADAPAVAADGTATTYLTDPVEVVTNIRTHREAGLREDVDRYERWRDATGLATLDGYFRATRRSIELREADELASLASQRALALYTVYETGEGAPAGQWSIGTLATRVGLKKATVQGLIERGRAATVITGYTTYRRTDDDGAVEQIAVTRYGDEISETYSIDGRIDDDSVVYSDTNPEKYLHDRAIDLTSDGYREV